MNREAQTSFRAVEILCMVGYYDGGYVITHLSKPEKAQH